MEIHLSGKVYFYARDLARRIGRRHGWEADQVGKVKHLLLNLAPIMGKKTSIFAVLPDENGAPGGGPFPRAGYRFPDRRDGC